MTGLFASTERAAESAAEPVELDFWVPGKPQTAGSKRAFVNPKTGRAMVVEDHKAGTAGRKKSWRADLREAAERAILDGGPPGWWPLGGPMRVHMIFMRARPGSHYGSGRNSDVLKPTAAGQRPVQRPDLLKLARAVEDALTSILWADDSQIVSEEIEKEYSEPIMARGTEGVAVRVIRLDPPAPPGQDQLL